MICSSLPFSEHVIQIQIVRVILGQVSHQIPLITPTSHDLDMNTMDNSGQRKLLVLLLLLMLRLLRRPRWIFLLCRLLHLPYLHLIPLLSLDHHLLHLTSTSISLSAQIRYLLMFSSCIKIIKRICVFFDVCTLFGDFHAYQEEQDRSFGVLASQQAEILQILLPQFHSPPPQQSFFFFFVACVLVSVSILIFHVVLDLCFGVVCMNLSWFVIL